MPAYAYPVVERLERQVGIFGGLQLDYGQSPAAIYAQQIYHAPLTTSKCRNLPVNWLGPDSCIQYGWVAADFRLEPQLGVSRVERILTISHIGRSQVRQFLRQCFH